VRIRWGRRLMGRARPRHRNNFDFYFVGGDGGSARHGGGLVALGGMTQFGHLMSISPTAPH